jgi:putative endonuclease
MVMQRGGCIYIVTNLTHSVLYIGVTSDIITRIWEHKNKVHPKSFTAKYNCTKLVYYNFTHTLKKPLLLRRILKPVSGNQK